MNSDQMLMCLPEPKNIFYLHGQILILTKPALMKYFPFLFLLFMFSCKPKPVTHTITFAPFAFTPGELDVHVGDTIVWNGDFASHPLTGTSAPEGATPIEHISEGTTFSYVVAVPGVYNYQCDNHHRSGMTGAFTATAP
jgi:plastocyanin